MTVLRKLMVLTIVVAVITIAAVAGENPEIPAEALTGDIAIQVGHKGQSERQITVKTDQSAYVWIFETDAQNYIRLLFPNKYSQDNFIQGRLKLPDGNYSLPEATVPGENYLVAIAAKKPLPFLSSSKLKTFPVVSNEPQRYAERMYERARRLLPPESYITTFVSFQVEPTFSKRAGCSGRISFHIASWNRLEITAPPKEIHLNLKTDGIFKKLSPRQFHKNGKIKRPRLGQNSLKLKGKAQKTPLAIELSPDATSIWVSVASNRCVLVNGKPIGYNPFVIDMVLKKVCLPSFKNKTKVRGGTCLDV